MVLCVVLAVLILLISSVLSIRGLISRTHVTVWSWNVDGIRAPNRAEMLSLLVSKEAPDVLCLQETKLKVEVQGYG